MPSWYAGPDRQDHYKKRRSTITEINISQVTAKCFGCGYIEIQPDGGLEERNGGLMVSRKAVTITNESGEKIKRLRNSKKRKFLEYYCCNHCANHW